MLQGKQIGNTLYHLRVTGVEKGRENWKFLLKPQPATAEIGHS